MKLDKKYFPHFMVVMAIFSALIIVYSSLRFQKKQKVWFQESIAQNDTLTTQSFRYIQQPDSSVSISDYLGKNVVLVFWTSWSEKSTLMLNELYTIKEERKDVIILAALVKDAIEAVDFDSFPNLIYIDGASVFNDLKVPGVPSYILFDVTGNYKYAHVGYQDGSGYSIIDAKLNE